jgi:hypothetical protein
MDDKYKLAIRGVIPTPPPLINTFSVVIKYMHGDADHYTTNIFNFTVGDTDTKCLSIQDIIHIINEWSKIDWNTRCDMLRNGLSTWIVSLGYTDTDIVYELFESDVTNYDSFCHIDSYDIYWFNENGIKYKVDIIDIETNEQLKINLG